MRSLRAVPLVLLSLAALSTAAWTGPACAQRGGGGHAGPAPAPAAHGSFGSATRPGFSPTSRGSALSGSHNAYPAANRSAATAPGSLFLPPGITSTRPVFYSNGIRRYGDPGRQAERNRYGGVGYGFVSLGYPGYLDASYLDSGYLGDFDNSDASVYPEAPYPQNTAQDAFAPGQPDPGYQSGSGVYSGTPPAENPYGLQPETLPEPAVPTPYLPQRKPQPATAPAPPPEEDAVTIVYKDGRPSEQIRNYALTRTTLYITTDKVRAVPVDQIDLAATAKINEKAGVEFQLPAAK